MERDEPRSPQGPEGADGRTVALEELRQIFGDLNRVTDINDLKPLFYRLESLGQKYSGDSDVQSVLAEVRQRLIAKGQSLMDAGAPPAKGAVVPPPEPAPKAPTEGPKAPPTTPTPPTVTARTPPPPAPAAASGAYNWKKTVVFGAIIGVVVFAVGIVALRRAKKPPPPPPVTAISFPVRTTPAGAAIRVNNEPRCTSDCTVSLNPGEYQIQAFLDGYEPAVRTVTITASAPAGAVEFQLQPAPQAVRINADIDGGKVTLDAQEPIDLVDGAATLDKVTPGRHTVKVSGRGVGEATFTFEIVPGKAPVIDAPPVARNLVAVMISNFQTAARLHSNKADLKVAVDAQPAGQPGQQGMDLPNLQSGFREITFGEGEDAQKKLISIGPAPTLTAFLMRPAVTTGSLMVVAGEDGATIFINGREYRGRTERGSRRIPNLPMGAYKVRVAKEGYQGEPEKEAIIKKGEETKVEFRLRSIPKLSALTIRGGPAGAAIFVDGNQIGTVGADGNFSAGNIQPGDHIVELRRERAQRRIPKQFRAGETVEIGGAETALERLAGRLKINVVPADARVTYRRSDEPAGQARPAPTAEFQVPEGTYVISATAPNFAPRIQNITIASGENKIVDLALTPAKGGGTTTTTSARAPVGMDGWENPGAWTAEGGWQMARGGDYLPFKVTPTYGTFSFNVRLVRGGQIKWFLNFTDARNHIMFLLNDNGKFTRRIVVDGRRQDVDYQHGLRSREFTVQIEVEPNGIKQQLLHGTDFKPLDTWNGPVSPSSKFGVYLPSRDQIGLANFKFTPR